MNAIKKKLPELNSDKEAEAFLERDLSDLDFLQFKPVRFEFEFEKKEPPAVKPEAL